MKSAYFAVFSGVVVNRMSGSRQENIGPCGINRRGLFGSASMHLQSNAHQRMDEYRRYFPDWTHRSLRIGEELEADHNSYLASGYAEEFGYLAQAESSRGVPLIDGESPDDYALRLVQRAGMHPGYPLKPFPVAVDREKTARRRATSSSRVVSHDDAFEIRDHGKFVRVTERPYEHEHRQLAHRAVSAVTRLVAAVVARRWERPSLVRGVRRR